MLQLSPARKNKICLTDYNSALDIAGRTLISNFGSFELAVLEEILFSSLKISLKKLARSLSASESDLSEILHSFATGGLLSIEGDAITVDKERRKYFEFEIQRFDDHFRPDLDFTQGLLKKVPIHVLPSWYSLPRSSNNIFESVIEKHLLSPQIYQRYLNELNFGDSVIQGILDDVLNSKDLRMSSSDLIAKYNLSRADFEEIMLLLEFNLAAFVSYVKEDDHWHEVVSPLYEWSQYLKFLKQTEAPPIETPETIVLLREGYSPFLEDASCLLLEIQSKPLDLTAPLSFKGLDQPYLERLIAKLCQVRLAEKTSGKLKALEWATDFCKLSPEEKSLLFYRHPHNRILSKNLPMAITTERNIREAEKAVRRILHGKWVYLEDLIKGACVALSEDSVSVLKKTGRHWNYTIPCYSDAEKELIRATLFELLFEAGLIAVGTHDGKDCLAVTPFGRFFFES